tara:strand:- start:908 stop:1609 length:702 start_codon:yes stop_codon:yes gene_type:complete
MSINFSAMILAAGLGKRMLPLTKNLPKPLIDINGSTLLDNSINFLKKLGCNQIIINTHYQNLKIENSIKKRNENNLITLIYEKQLLDTGGAVKNALPLFKNNYVIVVNSDVYWQEENLKDVKNLLFQFSKNFFPRLLLVDKKNAYGLVNNKGDFVLNGAKVKRYTDENHLIFFAGLQIFDLNLFTEYNQKKFSFNIVWDSLIRKKLLYGELMQSKWYHVGDIHGLTLAKELYS